MILLMDESARVHVAAEVSWGSQSWWELGAKSTKKVYVAMKFPGCI